MAIDRKDYQYIHNSLGKSSVASNDNSWHGDSYISLTVVVPAGETYYLWGKCIGNIRYFLLQL